MVFRWEEWIIEWMVLECPATWKKMILDPSLTYKDQFHVIQYLNIKGENIGGRPRTGKTSLRLETRKLLNDRPFWVRLTRESSYSEDPGSTTCRKITGKYCLLYRQERAYNELKYMTYNYNCRSGWELCDSWVQTNRQGQSHLKESWDNFLSINSSRLN